MKFNWISKFLFAKEVNSLFVVLKLSFITHLFNFAAESQNFTSENFPTALSVRGKYPKDLNPEMGQAYTGHALYDTKYGILWGEVLISKDIINTLLLEIETYRSKR